MRLFTFALMLLAAPLAAADPTEKDLIRLEQKLRAANANVGPSLACIVVSRSEHYPKPDTPAEAWQLGRFDRTAFLKAHPKELARADRLDLSHVESIPDHGFSGGVVIDASGLILTNYHAIEGATKIFVHLPGRGGSYADIHAADSRCDLAVLKLLDPPVGMKAIKFGRVRLEAPNATVAPGTLGLVMAFPYSAGVAMDRAKAGLATLTKIRLREGKKASGLFRSIYSYGPLLEFESKFDPGASGAALVNLDGELIGLTSTIAGIPDGSESGRALPLDENMTRLIEVLRRGEEIEYGFLGVSSPNFPPRGIEGITIEGHVSPGSPAAAARLQPGDVITKINGVPVAAFEDLLLHIGHGLAGREIELTVQRGFNQPARDATVTLAKFKNEMPFIASVKPKPVFGLTVDHRSVLVQALVFNPFGGVRPVEIPKGVLALDPLPDSPAAAKFKQLGENARWIITHVNGRGVASPAEFYKEAAGQKSIRLTVVDPVDAPGRPQEITLP